ncbi:hypothetical protein [uncultured Sphingomonas sp.]|uniref:hypothetical protein n=1 Tax=uncultured Sphingomonas sp. TaxID=158754 RepID=UPI0025F89B18|nr:hypothetical protein [uncultured Sphingomonas sp.]
MNNLTPYVRPAKVARATSSLTNVATNTVNMAREHLRTGNPGAYARLLAGQYRASTARQQEAIEAVIAADACQRLFTRHAFNGRLVAREG